MFLLCAIRYEVCQHFIIAKYGVINYSLLMQTLVTFYSKPNEISDNEFYFSLEVSFSIVEAGNKFMAIIFKF